MQSSRLVKPASKPDDSFRIVSDVAGLDCIHAPQVNLTVWERQLPLVFQRSIGRWHAPLAFDAVFQAASFDVREIIKGVDDELREFLRNDIEILLERFAALAQVSRFRVRFGAVPDDQCRKFHVDYFRLRMVTTYAGPGTEWLPDTAVNRAALEPSTELAAEANKQIVRDPDQVRHAQAGDVLLLKGVYFGAGSTAAAVHRSPPIERRGMTRVVLVTTAYREDA